MRVNVWPLAIWFLTTLAMMAFGLPGIIAFANMIGKPTALASVLFYTGGWMALVFAPGPAVPVKGD